MTTRKARPSKLVWVFAAMAALLPAVAISGPAPQADKRKPGLYWTWVTDKGNISCQLYEKEAPVTVHTMVGLAIGKMSYIDPTTQQVTKKRFFDGLTFHRVIPEFMIQGGDPTGTGRGRPSGPGFPMKNENTSMKFDKGGRLAMANAGPDTNTSQFFITETDRDDLNGNYTIWGQCDNVNVVKQIARVKTDSGDKPLMPVHIQKVICWSAWVRLPRTRPRRWGN